MTRLFSVLLICILFSMSFCDNKSSGGKAGSLKIINVDLLGSQNNPLKIVYYKEWNEKKNKPYGRISAASKEKLKNYFEIGYNSKKKIEKIIKYQNKKPFLSIIHRYSPRGHINEKIVVGKSRSVPRLLRLRQRIADIKVISHYNSLGMETREITHTLESGQWKKRLVKRFTGNRKLDRMDELDSSNRLMFYSTHKYNGDKLVSKTTYSRDSLLKGSDEYYKEMFLDNIEYFGSDGKVLTKKWYHKEENPNKLWWTDRFQYRNKWTYINSYNTKNKLIQKKVEDENGKVISSELLDQK